MYRRSTVSPALFAAAVTAATLVPAAAPHAARSVNHDEILLLDA